MEVRLATSLLTLALVSQACSSSQPELDPAPSPQGGIASENENPAAGPSAVPDAEVIALGERIYQGKAAGGTCHACHGNKGEGSGVGPDLTDNEWLNTDGSLQGIRDVIVNGVPQPKKHEGAMPPKGGATLSDEQVDAVTAYVFSLSH